jgi:hypothetical protein
MYEWIARLCGCVLPPREQVFDLPPYHSAIRPAGRRNHRNDRVEAGDAAGSPTGLIPPAEEARPPFLDNLPAELVLQMSMHLRPTRLLALSQTSGRYRTILRDKYGAVLEHVPIAQRLWQERAATTGIKDFLEAVSPYSDGLDPAQQIALVDQAAAQGCLPNLGPAMQGFCLAAQERFAGTILQAVTGSVKLTEMNFATIELMDRCIQSLDIAVFGQLIDGMDAIEVIYKYKAMYLIVKGIPRFQPYHGEIIRITESISSVGHRAGVIQTMAPFVGSLDAELQGRVVDIVAGLTDPDRFGGLPANHDEVRRIQGDAIASLGKVGGSLAPQSRQRLIELAVLLGDLGWTARKFLRVGAEHEAPEEEAPEE